MTGRGDRQQGEEQTTGATPPDLKLNLGKERRSDKQTGKQNAAEAGQAGERNPDAVAAGHGNQVQDNETRIDNSPIPSKQDDLRAGAQPDGPDSISERRLGNEDIEQASESRNESGIE
ncbi:MAG: hypothetical protein M3X11_15495 [Acidobacteriota bacterium]|nr:hypothetical protein [Acidobacteriota bacterium]